MAYAYSLQIAAGAIAAGVDSAVYTVPVGNLLVIRCVSVHCASAAAATFGLTIAGVANILILETATTASQPPWNGRMVLKAGQVLHVNAAAQAFEYIISGYLLSD